MSMCTVFLGLSSATLIANNWCNIILSCKKLVAADLIAIFFLQNRRELIQSWSFRQILQYKKLQFLVPMMSLPVLEIMKKASLILR